MQRTDESREQWGSGEAARSGSTWAGVLSTTGLAVTTAGAALALGPPSVPELAEAASRLLAAGIQPGVVLFGGLVTTGLGVVLGRVSALGGQLRSAEESMEVIQTLSLSMRHLVERVTRLSAELGELKEADRALLRLAQDRTGAEAAGQQVDATFRLAASVDRLERRLEERLSGHEQALGSRVDQLGLALGGAQDQLRGLLATTCRLGEQLERLEEFAARAGETAEGGDEPLEITVELDPELDDGDGRGDEPAPHPSSFDWDSVRIPGRQAETGMGFLDAFEDEPSVAAPLPGDAPADLASAGAVKATGPQPGGLTEEGLGLLDALEAEAPPLQGPPAPLNLSLDDLPSIRPATPPLTAEDLDEAWEVFERRRNEDG
jgi:FtsZ-binding cell division protein ZapB